MNNFLVIDVLKTERTTLIAINNFIVIDAIFKRF